MDEDTINQIMAAKKLTLAELDNVIVTLTTKTSSSNKQLSNLFITGSIQPIINKIAEQINSLIEMALNAKTKNDNLIEKIENAISKSTNYIVPPTYAQIAKPQPIKQRSPLIQENPEDTIMITAINNTNPNLISIKTHEAIDKIRITNKKLKINKIIKTSKGAIIKVPTSENTDQIISNLNESDIKNIAKIQKSKKLDPIIVLKSISKSIDLQHLPSIICNPELNPSLENCENKMLILFAIKSNRDTHDVVARVNPHIYDTIMKNGYLYTNYEKILIKNKILIRQCQRCFKYDHHTKHCKNDKICKCCGTTQETNHECTTTQKCINCLQDPKHKNSNLCHVPNNNSCPIYHEHTNKIINNTSYAGSNHDIITNRNNQVHEDESY